MSLTTYTEQRHNALDRANEIRLARADLKQRIRAGQTPISEVILAPPSEARSWRIGEMLMSQRRWGRTRTAKLLSRTMIPERKPLETLTERQRKMLADALKEAQ